MSPPSAPAPAQSPATVLFDHEAATSVLYRGILITTWRTWVRPDLLTGSMQAVERAIELHPEGIAILSIHQLDRRFPITVEFRDNLPDLARTLRRIRKDVRVVASVAEFEGFLATAFRVATRAVVAAGAPSLRHRMFSSRIDAVHWLSGELGPAHATSEAEGELLGVTRFVSGWRAQRDAQQRAGMEVSGRT